jgi:hypothetical protein
MRLDEDVEENKEDQWFDKLWKLFSHFVFANVESPTLSIHGQLLGNLSEEDEG